MNHSAVTNFLTGRGQVLALKTGCRYDCRQSGHSLVQQKSEDQKKEILRIRSFIEKGLEKADVFTTTDQEPANGTEIPCWHWRP
jgi:hypothetical protein